MKVETAMDNTVAWSSAGAKCYAFDASDTRMKWSAALAYCTDSAETTRSDSSLASIHNQAEQDVVFGRFADVVLPDA